MPGSQNDIPSQGARSTLPPSDQAYDSFFGEQVDRAPDHYNPHDALPSDRHLYSTVGGHMSDGIHALSTYGYQPGTGAGSSVDPNYAEMLRKSTNDRQTTNPSQATGPPQTRNYQYPSAPLYIRGQPPQSRQNSQGQAPSYPPGTQQQQQQPTRPGPSGTGYPGGVFAGLQGYSRNNSGY